MKICFITYDISAKGGQERALVSLANELASRNNGIDVTLLFMSSYENATTYSYPLDKKVKISWNEKVSRAKYKDLPSKVFRYFYKKSGISPSPELTTKLYYSRREIKSLESLVNSQNFDVIIGLSTYWAGILPLLNTKAKKIGWMHSSYDRYFNTKNEISWNQEKMYHHLLNQLDELIVLTDSAKKEYGKFLTIEPKRIYNLINIEDSTKIKRKSNELLFVGRISTYIKGIDYLLDILSMLREEDINFHATIVGDGMDYENLKNEIEKKKLHNFISLEGRQENIAKYYNRSTMLLLTSRLEGFGLVALEAMSHGLPVISFATEGPKEIITNGQDGYIVPKFNTVEFSKKIIKLLENEIDREKISFNAYKRSKDFSNHSVVEKWERVLKNEKLF